jgi:hypothetical protein
VSSASSSCPVAAWDVTSLSATHPWEELATGPGMRTSSAWEADVAGPRKRMPLPPWPPLLQCSSRKKELLWSGSSSHSADCIHGQECMLPSNQSKWCMEGYFMFFWRERTGEELVTVGIGRSSVRFPGRWRPHARASGIRVPGPPASSQGCVAERPTTFQAAAARDASRGGAVKSSVMLFGEGF